MSAHFTADPAATGAAVFPARLEWLALSAAFADEVPVIADRDDLVVSVAPGAGGDAPACFYPHRALIEVDGDHLGVDPATVDPANLSDRTRYAPAWGALTHECGHAKHTVWEPPDGAPPAVVAAALLLEEPRMEAAQIRRRPDDRHWLRACVKGIVATDLHLFADPVTAPKMTPADAAHTAALLLGRADGRVLTHAEVYPVARVIEDVLGTDVLGKLRAVWRQALRTADDAGEEMLDLGRQEVTEFRSRDNYEDIPRALDALDGSLGLSRPGAARLVVIVSDGDYRRTPRRDGQTKLDRLRASGCAVLWLTTSDTDTPLAGATVHVLTDPTMAARAIGHAATSALRAARH
ncbi:hypothetical protein [Amycolatopsis sp. NPDC098790]|uniref:hypothetical protein n=1 Tax=Amycolatopsis sp. NPDC098790 TaxID=3363939 RepID=UPI003814967D